MITYDVESIESLSEIAKEIGFILITLNIIDINIFPLVTITF